MAMATQSLLSEKLTKHRVRTSDDPVKTVNGLLRMADWARYEIAIMATEAYEAEGMPRKAAFKMAWDNLPLFLSGSKMMPSRDPQEG